MAEKQALNATFFAFKKRERGGVLFGATLVYAVLAVLGAGLFIGLNWQAFADYMNWVVSMSQQANVPADPNNPFAGAMPPQSVMALGAWYLLFLVGFYLLLAAYEAACLRWMIRGETKGLFGFALDGDTWRVYFTYWVWFFLAFAAYLVIVMAVFGLMAGAMVSAPSDPSAMPVLGPAAVIAVLLVLLFLIYFGVRFAPAAATSVAKRRFAFFDAWTVTKGRFWALLGAFVLLWLMYFVGVLVLSGVAGFAIGTGMMGQMQTGQEPTTPQDAMAMFAQPGVWAPLAIVYGVMIAGAFVFYVALFGVNARAAVAALEEGKITAAQA